MALLSSSTKNPATVKSCCVERLRLANVGDKSQAHLSGNHPSKAHPLVKISRSVESDC